MTNLDTRQDDGAVVVGAADLQGERAVFCPNPKMPLWSNHPRVFIDVTASCRQTNGARRFTAMMSSHSSIGASSR